MKRGLCKFPFPACCCFLLFSLSNLLAPSSLLNRKCTTFTYFLLPVFFNVSLLLCTLKDAGFEKFITTGSRIRTYMIQVKRLQNCVKWAKMLNGLLDFWVSKFNDFLGPAVPERRLLHLFDSVWLLSRFLWMCVKLCIISKCIWHMFWYECCMFVMLRCQQRCASASGCEVHISYYVKTNQNTSKFLWHLLWLHMFPLIYDTA